MSRFFWISALLVSLGIVSCGPKAQTPKPYMVEIKNNGGALDDLTGVLPVLTIWTGSMVNIGYYTQSGSNDFVLAIENPVDAGLLSVVSGVTDFTKATIDKPGILATRTLNLYGYQNIEKVCTVHQGKSVTFDPSSGKLSDVYEAKLIYVQNDVRITGQYKEDGKLYSTFNVTLKKGWNKYVEIAHADLDGNVVYEYTSQMPDGLIWTTNVI